jgi:hypothetical protein
MTQVKGLTLRVLLNRLGARMVAGKPRQTSSYQSITNSSRFVSSKAADRDSRVKKRTLVGV